MTQPKRLALFTALFLMPSILNAGYTADGEPRVYKGAHGETVIIQALKPRSANQVVVWVKNSRSVLDDHPVAHTVRQSSGKVDFVTQKDGKDWVTITGRDNWYNSMGYELYVPNQADSIKITYAKKDSAKVASAEVLDFFLFRKPASTGGNAGEDKTFAAHTADMNRACGSTITTKIDWASFGEHGNSLRVGDACGQVVQAMEELCGSQVAKDAI
ncbi:hypothetical protein K2X33_10720, partial [bacterium]|nr:hypothetical protein [bacterium]